MMTFDTGYLRRTLVVVIYVTLASALVPNPPCDGCKSCPMDMPGCCYDEHDNAIEAGTLLSNPDNQCYMKTCKDGKIEEDYYCPTGFRAIGRGCYHIGPHEGTWFEGRDYCKTIGGDLAILDTEEEAEALEGEIDPFLPDGPPFECPNVAPVTELEKIRQGQSGGQVGPVPCVEFCLSDDNCMEGQKCCSNGCGHECMPSVCPPGWAWFDGSCYFASYESVEWSEAQERCEGRDAHLVTINSQAENDFLLSVLSQNPDTTAVGQRFWIGLIDRFSDNMFEWDDGTELNYTNWMGGFPNNMNAPGPGCGIIFGGGIWVHNDCEHNETYICEKERDTNGSVSAATHGLLWLGASTDLEGGSYWLNNVSLDDTYTNFPQNYSWPPDLESCLTAYCREGDVVCYQWFYLDCYLHYQPLCEAECTEITCKDKDTAYPVGTIMWKDPDCECSWIECGPDGQPVAIQKERPCCTYRDAVYGNGEIVDYSMCTQTKCEKGKLVTYPFCTTGFVPITYAGTSSCYHFSDKPMSFNEAQQYCEMKGSKLVEISSCEENDALQQHLHQPAAGAQEHWLNAQAQVCTMGKLGKLRWLSDLFDTPVESVYSDFCESYPIDSSSAKCLHMVYTGEMSENDYCWLNSDCHKPRYAICEKCSKCERDHIAVCYHDNKFIKHGEVTARKHINRDDCMKTYCDNGQMKTVLYRCE